MPEDHIRAGDTPALRRIFKKKVGSYIDTIKVDGAPGDNLLMFASRHGQVDAVKYLLSKGVSVAAVNAHGDTALMLAVDGGHHDVVAELVAAGAPLRKRDARGLCVLHRLARRATATGGDIWMVKLLLTRSNKPRAVRDPNNETAMQVAVRRGAWWMVELMLGSGGGENTGLMEAVRNRVHVSLLQGLLLHGAVLSIDERNGEGCTALMIAVHRNYLPAVQLLLAAGADMGIPDLRGETPLMAAATNTLLFRDQPVTAVLDAMLQYAATK
jgi:ankyrin repeat protein